VKGGKLSAWGWLCRTLYHRLSGLVVTAALVAAPPAGAEPLSSVAPHSSVADLRYGVTLYEYYQENYLQALTELMVAEARGGIQGHKDNPQLIVGGISLAYGMEKKASAIFAELLDEEHPLAVRNAAWFYLAKLRYQRGDWAGAQDSLERVKHSLERNKHSLERNKHSLERVKHSLERVKHSLERADDSLEKGQRPETRGEYHREKLTRVLAAERVALKTNLAIHRGELASASEWLQQASADGDLFSRWLPYLYYNLGAAYSRAGDYAQAQKHYAKLTQLPVPGEANSQAEHLALYDKALTAAGYSHLLQAEYPAAIAQFARVRRDSYFSNRALLGYGWAAARDGDYAKALQPWQVLSQRSLLDATVQESLLALPYAYEKLAATGQALEAYRRAQQSYEREIGAIDVTLRSLQAENWFDRLQLLDTVQEKQTWLSLQSAEGNKVDLFVREGGDSGELPVAYMTELFAQNRFQGQVQELRELLQLQQSLQSWEQKLETYTLMLQERRRARAVKEEAIARRELAERRRLLREQRDQYAAELQRIDVEKDYLALAPSATAELFQRVVRAQQAVARLQAAGEPAAEIAEYRESLRRYRGLLLWQANDSYADQLWQNRKQLKNLDAALEMLEENYQRLSGVVATAPDVTPYQMRMVALNNRLQAQQQQVELALNQAQQQLRVQVVERLQQHRSRLRHDLAQARLSVARLLDAAYSGRQQAVNTPVNAEVIP